MSNHHRLCPGFNQSTINFSVCRIPLFTGEIVHTCKNMLIHLVTTIAREMLDRNKNIFFFCRFHIVETTCQDTFRIIAICPHIGNRVSPVSVDINDWCKSPVTSNRRSFTAAYFSKTIRIFYISGRCDLHLFAILGSVRCDSASAILQIRPDQKRNLTVFLQIPMCLLHLFCFATPIHDSSNMMGKHHMFKVIRIS